MEIFIRSLEIEPKHDLICSYITDIPPQQGEHLVITDAINIKVQRYRVTHVTHSIFKEKQTTHKSVTCWVIEVDYMSPDRVDH